jgi:hypothetical protein
MSIIELIVAFIIVGVVVYVLNAVVPMDARFKLGINALIGLALFLWLLDVIGVYHIGHIGRLR